MPAFLGCTLRLSSTIMVVGLLLVLFIKSSIFRALTTGLTQTHTHTHTTQKIISVPEFCLVVPIYDILAFFVRSRNNNSAITINKVNGFTGQGGGR